MPTASNGRIDFEGAQQLVPFETMTDSGDHKVFNFSNSLVSKRAGFEPEIRPDGIVTGLNLIEPTATQNAVAVGAFTCYLNGILKEEGETASLVVARHASLSHIVSSIVYDGTDISAVQGTGHASAHTEERGVAGGPPSIPIGSIEVGQIRYTSTTAGVVTTTDIHQSVEGGAVERYDFPLWNSPNCVGYGNRGKTAAKMAAFLEFYFVIPMIHGATATSPPTARKPVYAKYYTPEFVTIENAEEFKPAETSVSVSSKQIYRKSIGSSSTSLGAGGFTAYVNDGISDTLAKLAGELLAFRFFPDENREAHSITQGYLSVQTSYPVADQINVAVTIAAEEATANFEEL